MLGRHFVIKVRVPTRLFIWKAKAGRQFLASQTLYLLYAKGREAQGTPKHGLPMRWDWTQTNKQANPSQMDDNFACPFLLSYPSNSLFLFLNEQSNVDYHLNPGIGLAN